MNRTGWLVFAVVVVAVVLCGCLALALIIPGWFATDTGFFGRGMGPMFDHCPWCGQGGFGSIGVGELLIVLLIFGLLLLVIAAVVVGIIWLARSSAASRPPEPQEEERPTE